MLCASHVKKTSIKNFWVNSHAQIAWPTQALAGQARQGVTPPTQALTRAWQPDPTIASAILGSTALESLRARPAQPDRTAPMGHYLHLNASEASRQWWRSKCVRHV
jgi:hypothetical protein